MASVPQASVEFARQRLGPLSGSAALLIRRWRHEELAARKLVKRGVAEVLILGRDPRVRRDWPNAMASGGAN